MPILRVALAALALVALSVGFGVPARADLGPAFARFADDSFSETAKAIDEIAASGAPTAAAILEALADRRLLFHPPSRAVLIKDASGRLLDAATGKPAAGPAGDASVVRINNRLRGQIESALGGLSLASPDPARRIQAAEAIFKSRDAKTLPAVTAALERERDASVRRAFERVRAVIILEDPAATRAARLAAIATLAERVDQDSLGVLRSQFAASKDQTELAAIELAIVKIERQQRLLETVQNIWYGLSLGSVLLLAAIGLAITFGVMGVINMAHGEMVMLGAYTTFVVQEAFRAIAPGWFDWSLPIAVPLAFLVSGLVGLAIERGVIRFLYGRPLETLLATWGISLVLQQTVRTAFGPTNREVGAPSYMQGAMEIGGVSVAYGRLWIITFTLVVFALLLALLKATPLGLQMRAVTQNRRMAAAMGIRSGRVDAMTFALGSGIAGIAGVALSQIDNVSPNLGQAYIIDSFMVVVFGGVGNLWGTFVSAFFLGIANKFLEPFAGAVLAKILILVLLILFIQKRPRGLFALKGRAVEA
jgi:urea transport system permease protein